MARTASRMAHQWQILLRHIFAAVVVKMLQLVKF
eukprot:COSAG01_NODE_9447_length_2445_cov_3.513214_3_plen_33_part_01